MTPRMCREVWSFQDLAVNERRLKRTTDALKPFSCAIEPIHTAAACANPQLPATILEDGRDLAVGDRCRIERVVAEDDELIAVVAIEAVLRSEPHEAAPVLDDCGDGIL